MSTTRVCHQCGGDNIFFDAWVNVNDNSDVRTFDATFCEDCDSDCWIVTKKERSD